MIFPETFGYKSELSNAFSYSTAISTETLCSMFTDFKLSFPGAGEGQQQETVTQQTSHMQSNCTPLSPCQIASYLIDVSMPSIFPNHITSLLAWGRLSVHVSSLLEGCQLLGFNLIAEAGGGADEG